jgi:chloride channel protein, CIC family
LIALSAQRRGHFCAVISIRNFIGRQLDSGLSWNVPLWPKTIDSVYQGTLTYIRGHWRRLLEIRQRLWVSEEAIHLFLAGCVGVIGGGINLFFYHAVSQMQFLLTGEAGHNIVDVAEHLVQKSQWTWVIAIPAIGGLLAGLVLYWGLRFAGQQGTSNLVEVVVAGDGRLPFRTGIVRTFSSILSIGSGASIGREGGIVQLSATVASKAGQKMKWQPYRLRLLVACGAASGMAAAYNAPISGAVFAAQIVLGNFSMNLFAPLLFSSVIASMVSRSVFGLKPWYDVPQFEFNSITQLPWFIVLGVLTGILGAIFLKLLKYSKAIFKPVPSPYLQMAGGGILVGLIAIWFPEVWGNGYVVTNRILQQTYGLDKVVIVFFAKLLATVITVGAGAVGGVFTPTLFLGAGLGSIVGYTLQEWHLAPAHLTPGIFALVGMGSMLSATTRSPLLAIIMLLEISLNYSLMPALMLGCAVSTLVSRRLHPSSIYTEPLKMRSLEVESYRLGEATQQTVGDLMRAPVEPIRETARIQQIAERFLTGTNNFLPVVDEKRRLIGVVALHDLKEHLNAGDELLAVIAYDIMRPVPKCVTPGQKLLDALPVLLASEQRNIPVVNTFEENRLVGSLPRIEALGLLSEAIAATTSTTVSTEVQEKEEEPENRLGHPESSTPS